MGSEGYIVVVAGLILGWFFFKIFSKTKKGKFVLDKERERNKVLNDPDMLVQKLSEGAGFVDDGKDMNYSVVEKDGKKVVALDMQAPKSAKPEKKDNSKKVKK